MSEVDYQVALLLQHQFEQESKPESSSNDEQLARLLQEQFQHEENIEKPANNLIYDKPKAKSYLNSSKSLTDPSWELVDPTPDIHLLFVAFNERFFWNKLLSVCVSWSKRMTSCAGVCTYRGRGGMCSITLSEPLLKLRPRKDLVETLLHEMIHAFLFVTHNNRDRDGHGPEFHKHMYRINKETGTNITVYHTFHDEVKLYKQHWWRCDGPCQNRSPFFGMVKRAMNRAPGPQDRWWAEHSASCGGKFIKVKEPEKEPKKTPAVQKKHGEDIRKFITSKNNAFKDNITGFKDLNKGVKGRFNSSSTIVISKTSTVTSGSKNLNDSSSSSGSTNNINELYHNLPKNVKGFKDLNTSGSDFKPTIFNKNSNVAQSSKINSLDSNRKQVPSRDFESTRNHWKDKVYSSPKKRALSQSSSEQQEVETSSKVPRIEQSNCPVCNQSVPISEINVHLDLCLFNNSEDGATASCDDFSDVEEVKNCPVCKEGVVESFYDRHVEQCILKMHEEFDEELKDFENKTEKTESTECLACGKKIQKEELNSHLEECLSMSNIFEDDNNEDDKSDKDTEMNCPICFQVLPEDEMKEHVDACLNSSTELVNSFLDDDYS